MKSTNALLDHLAYLPLAIKQAAVYMAETGIPTTAYLEYYRNSDQEQIGLLGRNFEDRGRYPGTLNAITTTWLISFDRISKQHPLAAKYLKFICFLAEKNTSKSLLPPGSSNREMNEAMAALEGFAFITMREGENSFYIHRLVRLVMRNHLEGEDRKNTMTNMVRYLSEIYLYPKYDNKSLWIQYIPHVLNALEVRRESVDKHSTFWLLHCVAETYATTGKYEQREQMYRESLELGQKALGREHPDTFNAMNNLALLLDTRGKYREAEQINRELMKLKRMVLGPKDPSTVNSMNSLAVVLDSQKKPDEAEQLYRESLELTEETLGRKHLSTLSS
jgi:tetratricopeptide (TPR) repeat protein